MTALDSQPDAPRRPGRGMHRMALLTAFAVFPLIFVGAGVTTKEAGMAYPEGFTSNGHFLTNPPGWWEGSDTRWEHGHRLLGRTVGILAIVLAVWGWRYRGVIRAIGLATLLAICIQGVLGAFRVNEISTTLAMIHGIFGQLCFCLACVVGLVTAPAWWKGRVCQIQQGRFLKRLCLVATVAVFVQLVLGAAYRHFSSTPVLVAHVFWAIVVTFTVGWIAVWVLGLKAAQAPLVRLCRVLAFLMFAQLMLGCGAFVVSVMGGVASSSVLWMIPTLHVAVGALLLANIILLTLLVHRAIRSAPDHQELPEGAAVPSA